MFRVRQDWLPHAQAEGHGFDSGGVTWKLKINDKGVTWKIQPKEVETFDDWSVLHQRSPLPSAGSST